jgi:hypothetical protein
MSEPDTQEDRSISSDLWCLAAAAAVVPLILVVAAPWRLRPAAVNARIDSSDNGGWLWPAATWISALCWVLAGPAIVIAGSPLFVPILLPGLVIWARRIADSGRTPAALTLSDAWSAAGAHYGTVDGRRLVRGGAVALLAASVFWGAGVRLPHWPLVATIASGISALALLAITVFAHQVGSLFRELEAQTTAESLAFAATWDARIAQILHVTPSTLAAEGRYAMASDGSFVISRIPASAVVDRTRIEALVEAHAPEFTCASASYSEVILAPASAEVLNARQARAVSGGLFVGMAELESTPARPNARAFQLADGIGSSRAEDIAELVSTSGWTLVELLPARRTAVAARLDGETLALRDRMSGMLAARPWEVELVLTRDDYGQISAVDILRYPAAKFGVIGERRETAWRELIAAVPGAGAGWTTEDDSVRGTARLAFGAVRELPGLVKLSALVPCVLDSGSWSTLPLGVDASGDVASVGLTLGPHCLTVGPTGSGKTILLLAIVTAALTRDHRVILIDPIKGGVDFATVRPYLSAFAEDVRSAAAVMTAVCAEVTRRKNVLKTHGVGFWMDLPVGVRAAEGIAPWTVVIDEYASLILPAPAPKALDKEHPLVVEATALNIAKELVGAYAGKIAREARFVGVHLSLALQRPDASILGGEFRSNLTSTIQLAKPGSLPAREALTMLFPGDQTRQASEVLAELDDGHSRGLAVMAAEGGTVQGFRVAYAPASEIPGLLDAAGVEKPVPLVFPPLEDFTPRLKGRLSPAPAKAAPVALPGYDDFSL